MILKYKVVVKNILIGLTISLFFLIITLLITESIFQLLDLPPYPRLSHPKMYINTPNGVRLKSNFNGIISDFEFKNKIHINSHGMRGPEIDTNKESILMIGDSFTFGIGAEHEKSFVGLLQNVVKSYQVVNLGIPSIGTAEYLSILQENLEKFKNVSLVVVNFYIGNDFLIGSEWEVMAVEGYLIGKKDAEGLKIIGNKFYKYEKLIYENNAYKRFNENIPIFDTLFGKSKIYNLLISRLRSLSSFNEFLVTRGYRNKIECNFGIDMATIYNTCSDEGRFKEALEYIATMATITQSKDIRFIVNIIPSKPQVYEELLYTMPCNFDTALIDIKKSTNLIVGFLEAHNITYVNLQKEFEKLGKNPNHDLYYKSDTHFTPYGNSVVAGIMERYINKILRD